MGVGEQDLLRLLIDAFYCLVSDAYMRDTHASGDGFEVEGIWAESDYFSL